MRKIKVGAWFQKLNEQEQDFFKLKVERFGVQHLRSYFTAARKQFESGYEFGQGLTVTKDGKTFYFSSDWNKFFPLNGGN